MKPCPPIRIILCLSLLLLACAGIACGPQPVASPPSSSQEKMVNVALEDEKRQAYREDEIQKTVTIVRVEAIEETWDAMFLQGQKIGYGSTARKVVKGNDAAVMSVQWSSQQHMKLKRFGQTTEQTINFETDESPNGEVRTLKATLAGSSMNMETTGEVRDGFLELTVSTQGRKTTRSIPWEKGTAGFFGLEQSLRNKPMVAGEKRQIKWFQAVVNQIATDDLEALAEEDTPLLEGRRKLLKIKSSSKFGGQKIESFFWADAEGNILRSTIPGMMQEVYRTTKEIAMQPSDGSYDLGRASVVKVKRDLPNHVDLKRVVYLAKLKASNPQEIFPVSLSQVVAVIDEHTAKITVRKVTPNIPEKLNEPVPQPTKEDSASNNLIQSEDGNVLKLAQQVAPEETDPWQIATAAEQLVNRKLNKKNFSQGFASAAEVAKNLEGDCTEHAVLLAAICRAKKIPARVAAGLVYYAPEHGFAYHMWNEVWIRDRWVPLDATLARGGIGGGHIKLFDSNLNGADAFSAFLPVIHVLGQLELEIIEVE